MMLGALSHHHRASGVIIRGGRHKEPRGVCITVERIGFTFMLGSFMAGLGAFLIARLGRSLPIRRRQMLLNALPRQSSADVAFGGRGKNLSALLGACLATVETDSALRNMPAKQADYDRSISLGVIVDRSRRAICAKRPPCGHNSKRHAVHHGGASLDQWPIMSPQENPRKIWRVAISCGCTGIISVID